RPMEWVHGALALREGSGRLLAWSPLLLGSELVAGYEGRDRVFEHRLAGDDHSGHVLSRGYFVHHRLEDLFEDRAQAAGAGAAQDRLVGDGLQGAVGELQLHAVELQQLAVLLDE